MTATAPQVGGDTSSRAAARASARTSSCAAELTETSDGWRLTITLSDTDVAADLLNAIPLGRLDPGPGEFTMSVSPNLVPGHPFDIVEVRVILAEDQEPDA